MRGRYKLIKLRDGGFTWKLVGGNHRVILKGDRYETREQAERAIERCRRSAAFAERFLRDRARSGEPCFRLLDDTGKTVARSELYLSDAARDRGIEAVRANAPTPLEVDDNGD